nr:14179_t:CDS:2 [Entrophospora candida]
MIITGRKRCSYILRRDEAKITDWIREEVKIPNINLLLYLIKMVKHLQVPLEISLKSGLGRLINNKVVKKSPIHGVSEVAHDLLDEWKRTAKFQPTTILATQTQKAKSQIPNP